MSVQSHVKNTLRDTRTVTYANFLTTPALRSPYGLGRGEDSTSAAKRKEPSV